MNTITLELLEKLNIIHENLDQAALMLYKESLEQLDLSISDYLTIGDLVQLSGYNEPEIHALLLCMFSSVLAGNICLNATPESISGCLRPLSKDHKQLSKKMLSGLEKYPNLVYIQENPPSLFTTPQEAYKPVILEKGTTPRLYFQKYYVYENSLKQRLMALLKKKDEPLIAAGMIHSLFDDIIHQNPLKFNGQTAVIDQEQVLAILLPLFKNFTIISGGPGTGKTSIIVNMLRAFTRSGIKPADIKIAAPTGRATQRITQSIQTSISNLTGTNEKDEMLLEITCETIHRLLQYSPGSNSFYYNDKNPLPADIIIIDEASMIDVILLGKLLEALKANSRIIFLGDRNQLPAVDAGAIFADLVPEQSTISYSKQTLELLTQIHPAGSVVSENNDTPSPANDRVVLLHKNYRSNQQINRLAHLINAGNPDAVNDIDAVSPEQLISGKADTMLTDQNSIRKITKGASGLKSNYELEMLLNFWTTTYFKSPANGRKYSYVELVNTLKDQNTFDPDDPEVYTILNQLFDCLDTARILCPVKNGLSGTRNINKYICKILSGTTEQHSSRHIFNGSAIMITRNDYVNRLYNGDSGIVLSGNHNEYFAVFRQQENFTFFPLIHLHNHEPAFAITVHKSQGSEYGNILFVIDDNSQKLLSREIVYTAITRAKHTVLLYASDETLRQAVAQKITRDSGLSIVG